MEILLAIILIVLPMTALVSVLMFLWILGPAVLITVPILVLIFLLAWHIYESQR